MAVRVFIMKKIKFFIFFIIVLTPVSLFSAEITLLECSYDSGTKKIEGILNKELDSENKDYRPWDMNQKKFLEIDLDNEILTWENLNYKLLIKTPNKLYFRGGGNITPIGEEYSSAYDYTIEYHIDRVTLEVKEIERSNEVEKIYGAVSAWITIEKNYFCNKVERQL